MIRIVPITTEYVLKMLLCTILLPPARKVSASTVLLLLVYGMKRYEVQIACKGRIFYGNQPASSKVGMYTYAHRYMTQVHFGDLMNLLSISF